MSNPKHAPGPWELRYKPHNKGLHKYIDIEIWSKDRHVTTISEHVDNFKVDEANARLIAAAPEMLNELKVLQSFLRALRRPSFNEYIKLLRDVNQVIDKAEWKKK